MMRVPGLTALGLAALAVPALALDEPMPRTFDLDWTCGRALASGAVSGDGGSLALNANGARREFWIAEADQARMGPIVSAATQARYTVLAVGSELRTGRVRAVRIGARGARCGPVLAAAQDAYADAYDGWADQTAAPASSAKPKLVKIPRPQAGRAPAAEK